jgi:hypothetical protein
MKTLFRILPAVVLLGLFLVVGQHAKAQVFNQWPAQASSLVTAIAPATPAVSTPKASAGVVTHISCFNILATPVYVKLFDATSVTLGTTSASYQFMCPGNTAGAGFVLPFPWAITFANAIKYAVTGGISLTDNTAITASSVIVNIGYN